MSYNTDNLFDYIHDPGKEDYTYLPKSEKQEGSEAYAYCKTIQVPPWRKECLGLDWTYEVFIKKASNIASVVRAFRQTGPDIVVFVEVEKLEILQHMVAVDLPDLGYITQVLIEGPDERGIDIGVISKFPLAGRPVLHPVILLEDEKTLGKVKQTRGILEVPLKIDNKVISVLGNHWPSQSHPTTTRIFAAETLKKVISKMLKGTLAVAVGDFNTLETEKARENQNPVKDYLLVPEKWGHLIDVYTECLKVGGSYCSSPPNPPGTYYYRSDKKWNRLDRVFVTDSWLNDKSIRLSWNDFIVFSPKYIDLDSDGSPLYFQNYNGSPKDFNPKDGSGYSDHFPVVMEFDVN